MKVIGLTGGIATGKSTVASLLRERGAEIVNADELAREIVRPGAKGWRRVVEVFGPEILKEDRTIDREKLRKIIFSDGATRKKLESITHPLIRELANQRIRELAAKAGEMAVYEAPLLFEQKRRPGREGDRTALKGANARGREEKTRRLYHRK
jgi:dephospho-CoA kinase